MEVHSNTAYRWFLGLGLTDRVPDHSTLSYFRGRLREGDVLHIISDVHITPGNVHDSVPYIDRLKLTVKKFGFEKSLEAVALDAGYNTSHICKKLQEQNIYAVIGRRSFRPV